MILHKSLKASSLNLSSTMAGAIDSLSDSTEYKSLMKKEKI